MKDDELYFESPRLRDTEKVKRVMAELRPIIDEEKKRLGVSVLWSDPWPQYCAIVSIIKEFCKRGNALIAPDLCEIFSKLRVYIPSKEIYGIIREAAKIGEIRDRAIFRKNCVRDGLSMTVVMLDNRKLRIELGKRTPVIGD